METKEVIEETLASLHKELKIEKEAEKEVKTKRETELEEVEGKTALDWVEKQNEEITKTFASTVTFQEMEKFALGVYEDKRKIPYPSMRNGFLYNFWRDEDHVQGIYRRTTLEEYRKSNPKWELVLDIDNLQEEQWKSLVDPKNHMGKAKESWVYKGMSTNPPERDRGMVSLSLGGMDACIYREFDLVKKEFIKDGFFLTEAKSRVCYKDRNTLWIGTDFGPGSLTESGYPRVVKLWTRGEPLSKAKLIFEGEATDVSVGGGTHTRDEATYHWVSRHLDFYNKIIYMVNPDLSLTKLPIPLDAGVKEFFNHRAIIRLRKDWAVPNGRTYKAGSIVSLDLASIHDPMQLKTQLIFEPTEKIVVQSVTATKNYLFIKMLNNVCGEIHRFNLAKIEVNGEPQDTWFSFNLDLPSFGDVNISSAEDTSDDCIISSTNFLQPTTLYYYQSKKIVGFRPGAIHSTPIISDSFEVLKTAPSNFSSEGFTVQQFHATSNDSTQIPYFIVHSKELKYHGANPTLLYGYGGFEITCNPSYLGVTGKLWLEQGGTYVLANIRGGGEFGPKWHQAALKEHRHKAFEDFTSVALDLIKRKVTSPEYLGISGGSNGGLLVGAVFTQHPELFNAVICSVPLLDMLNYNAPNMKAGKSWMAEYGDPSDPKIRPAIAAYSPYQNVFKDKKYPEVLFKTSTRDDRVHPSHARKMVDKMQSMGHKVYYYENTEGGHGGAANLKQSAFSTALGISYLRHKLMHKLRASDSFVSEEPAKKRDEEKKEKHSKTS